MARLPKRSKKRLVLDIGSSTIRLCELSETKAGLQLSRYVYKDYNCDPALDEEERRSARSTALKELLAETKVRTKKTIFGVPGQSVFTRTRSLPPVPEYKVTQIVRYEIQQQIPFGLDQIAMDYQVLDRTEAGGYEVMMAAIKVDVVDKQVEILQEAKRSVDTVDVCPFAVYNWLKHTGELGEQNDCVAIIDIGAVTTDIVIEREGQFRFTRPLNIGGNDVTKAISTSFNMNWLDAERLKRERGFAPTDDPARDGKGGEVIGGVLQRLVSEIMRSFAYFRSLPGGGQVNRVVLCGGGACLRNIIPYLQKQLQLDVRIAQPLAGLAIAPDAQLVNEHPEQACAVLGLALRTVEEPTIGINLIPPRVLEAVRRREQAFYWGLCFATLALIMASIIPISENKNKMVKKQIAELRSTISLYDPEMAQLQHGQPVPTSEYAKGLQKAQERFGNLTKNVQTLNKARRMRRFWLEEIMLVMDARPSTGGNIWLSNFETSRVNKDPNYDPNRPGGNRPGTGGFGGGGGFASGGGGLFGNKNDKDGGETRARTNTGNSGSGGGIQGAITPGFVGIYPVVAAQGRGFGNQGANNNQKPNVTVNYPNGVIIHGFAESDTAILELVENLKTAERTGPDNSITWVKEESVYFSTSTVKRIPRSVLYQAPTGPTQAEDYNAPFTDAVYSFAIAMEIQHGPTKSNPDPDFSGQPAGAGTGTGFGGIDASNPFARALQERATQPSGAE